IPILDECTDHSYIIDGIAFVAIGVNNSAPLYGVDNKYNESWWYGYRHWIVGG
ncbi:hypothetical protein EVA_15889, partial [gut metagenome]